MAGAAPRGRWPRPRSSRSSGTTPVARCPRRASTSSSAPCWRSMARRTSGRSSRSVARDSGTMRVMKTFILLAVVLLAVPAFAQQVDIRTTPSTPPERPRDFVTPGPYYEVTEPRENQWYPEGVRVPYDPAFIAPMSEEYETPTTRPRFAATGCTPQNLPLAAP